MKAKNGDTVRVHYTGTLMDGTVFDSSRDREPLEFTLGKGQLLKGFETGVEGLKEGEKTNVEISAKHGYGERNEDLVARIALSDLPDHIHPEIGMKIQTQTKEGQTFILTIMDMDEEAMTVDANHELAGMDLNFEIELVEIIS